MRKGKRLVSATSQTTRGGCRVAPVSGNDMLKEGLEVFDRTLQLVIVGCGQLGDEREDKRQRTEHSRDDLMIVLQILACLLRFIDCTEVVAKRAQPCLL